MTRQRLNCWEYQGCGCGPGGARIGESGQCPSSTESSLHGGNHGINGGRSCWVISGTLCDGVVAGDFEDKYHECRKCAFSQRVEVEEGLDFEDSESLLTRYRGTGVSTG